MPSWVSVVVVSVLLLAVALAREYWRAHRSRHGRWVIDTNDERARDYWTNEPRAAFLEEWHYGGELAAAGECVAWRVPGLLKAPQLDELLRRTLEARTLLHRTSTAKEG